jgi:hypothetical protein
MVFCSLSAQRGAAPGFSEVYLTLTDMWGRADVTQRLSSYESHFRYIRLVLMRMLAVSMKDRFAVDIVEVDRAQLASSSPDKYRAHHASSSPENRLRSHQSSGSIIYICIDL